MQILLMSALVSFLLAFFEDHEQEGLRAFIEPFVSASLARLG